MSLVDFILLFWEIVKLFKNKHASCSGLVSSRSILCLSVRAQREVRADLWDCELIHLVRIVLFIVDDDRLTIYHHDNDDEI